MTLSLVASATTTDSNILTLTTGNAQLRAGQIVTGGNIATKIVTVNSLSNVTLASNIAITNGTAVAVTEDLLGNATFGGFLTDPSAPTNSHLKVNGKNISFGEFNIEFRRLS